MSNDEKNHKKQQPIKKPILEDLGKNLEQAGKNIQKAGRNFGNGLRSLVGLEEKPPLSDQNKPKPNSPEALDDMKKIWENTYEELLNNYRNQFDTETNKMKLRHKFRLKQIEQRDRRMIHFFEQQRHIMAENRLNRQEERLSRQQERKMRRHQRQEENQKKWDKIANRNQKRVENMVKGVNKFGWKFQFRIILILIPLLVVLMVVFMILKPFLGPFM